MIKEFEKLTAGEIALLLKAPVIFSLQALSADKEISKVQKEDAIKLVHLKTFTEHFLLQPYYEEAEKVFKNYFEECTAHFYPFDETNCAALKKVMDNIEGIINKLDKDYAKLLRKSLAGYAKHVSNAAHNVLQDIIFPVTFSKL
ncbi:hypothetical protein [Ferruginibacter profundus]